MFSGTDGKRADIGLLWSGNMALEWNVINHITHIFNLS